MIRMGIHQEWHEPLPLTYLHYFCSNIEEPLSTVIFVPLPTKVLNELLLHDNNSLNFYSKLLCILKEWLSESEKSDMMGTTIKHMRVYKLCLHLEAASYLHPLSSLSHIFLHVLPKLFVSLNSSPNIGDNMRNIYCFGNSIITSRLSKQELKLNIWYVVITLMETSKAMQRKLEILL